jgi:hypothetical protein
MKLHLCCIPKRYDTFNVTKALAKYEYYIKVSTICNLCTIVHRPLTENGGKNILLIYYVVPIFIQIALNGTKTK